MYRNQQQPGLLSAWNKRTWHDLTVRLQRNVEKQCICWVGHHINEDTTLTRIKPITEHSTAGLVLASSRTRPTPHLITS